MSSGALSGTAADLCSIRAGAPVTKTDCGAAPAAAAGDDDGFKQKVLNFISGNNNGGTKRKKKDHFYDGDLEALKKKFEDKYDLEVRN